MNTNFFPKKNQISKLNDALLTNSSNKAFYKNSKKQNKLKEKVSFKIYCLVEEKTFILKIREFEFNVFSPIFFYFRNMQSLREIRSLHTQTRTWKAYR